MSLVIRLELGESPNSNRITINYDKVNIKLPKYRTDGIAYSPT